jgi:hypothetical protein
MRVFWFLIRRECCPDASLPPHLVGICATSCIADQKQGLFVQLLSAPPRAAKHESRTYFQVSMTTVPACTIVICAATSQCRPCRANSLLSALEDQHTIHATSNYFTQGAACVVTLSFQILAVSLLLHAVYPHITARLAHAGEASPLENGQVPSKCRY